MKKVNLVLTLAALSTMGAVLSGCNSQDVIKIGILQPVEHEALSNAKNGFIAALAEKGFDEKKVQIVYRNAGGKEADINLFAKDLVATCDMTLGIGTGAAQALKSASIDKGLIKPVLFTAVTDPVGANLVTSLENGTGFVTGTSDAEPIDAQIQLINECNPAADKVGILYTQTEQNSVVQGQQAKDEIESLGMTAVTMTATGASDISATASSLAATEGLDAIYIPTDNNIAGNTDAVKNAVRGKGIIVVCGEEGMTRGCGHVTLSISYTNLGRVTGEMAAKILNKEATAASLAVKTMTAEDCEYVMCSSNIADANVTIPQSVIDKCRDISE